MFNLRIDSSDLLKVISENKLGILEQLRSEPMKPEKIRIINNGYFHRIWEDLDTKKDTFIILLPNDQLEDISLEKEYIQFKEEIIELIKSGYTKFIVDGNFDIKFKSSNTYSNTHEAFNDYKRLSYDNVVFFFGDTALDIFISGETDHYNTFFCAADLQRYTEKFTIEQLEEVLELYNNKYISKQDEYSRFFETKANINRLTQKYNYYVLKNSPEKFMRDNLRSYLNEHMQARFQIEVELPVSKNKLDLYTEVNGKFYFIEIKWLGKSINTDGTSISCNYTDSRARQGVKQTLQYIKELKNNTNNNIKCGILVIFDGREEKKEIDYDSFHFVEPDLLKYNNYFKVYDKLHLSNGHPC
jgi:hypothetical protein